MEWSFISKASVGKSTRLPILAREYLQGEEEGEEEEAGGRGGGRMEERGEEGRDEGEDIGILRWRKQTRVSVLRWRKWSMIACVCTPPNKPYTYKLEYKCKRTG